MDSLVFLYLGPETLMPLASALAAIVGVFLIFWRYIIKYARKAVGFFRGLVSPAKDPDDAYADWQADVDSDGSM